MAAALRTSSLLRCCVRSAHEDSISIVRARSSLSSLSYRAPASIQQMRPRQFTVSARVSLAQPVAEQETIKPEEQVVTRLAPASPSYFTGSADFFDNWLSLQDLYRKYQTYPTLPNDKVPRVRWKSLQQYRTAIGTNVKAAKYKKIVTLLHRLHRIEPALVGEDVTKMLDMFKREHDADVSNQKQQQIDKWGRAWATGRRKTSVARVWLVQGTGEALVNGKPLADAFPRLVDRENVIWPLYVTQRIDKYNIWALASGGGSTGQAEALTLGVAKALLVHEPLLKPALRRAGCITRDPRKVERKKPGHLKARKMPTWVKR